MHFVVNSALRWPVQFNSCSTTMHSLPHHCELRENATANTFCETHRKGKWLKRKVNAFLVSKFDTFFLPIAGRDGAERANCRLTCATAI